MLNPLTIFSVVFGLYYSPWSSFYNPYYTIVYYKARGHITGQLVRLI